MKDQAGEDSSCSTMRARDGASTDRGFRRCSVAEAETNALRLAGVDNR